MFHFTVSPVEILGRDRVQGVRLVRNRLEPDGAGGVRAVPTDEEERLDVGLIFRSVGYRGVALPGLPFDETRGVVPNLEGRVVEHTGSHTPLDGLYVCGWIKRGPTGVIGTNKACASQTVDQLLADAVAGRLTVATGDPDTLLASLQTRGVRCTDWADWQRLDQHEISRGTAVGKPREKLTTVREMLEHLDQGRRTADGGQNDGGRNDGG